MKLDITHNRENRTFHTIVNGRECYLKYREIGPTMLELYDTFVPLPERQQGIGSALVEEALRYAQLEGFLVVPTCSFVDDFMEDHHEYANLRVEPEETV